MKHCSAPPDNCDICNSEITNEFSDAVVTIGFQRIWASICSTCAFKYKVRYGLGLGQRYQSQQGVFVKVEG